MKIQQIRNATMKITMSGSTLLTDPMLMPRHGIRSFAGIEKNPTTELPFPVEEIIDGIDLVVVSHLHSDHFDDMARSVLPRDLPFFCQPGDQEALAEYGFTHVVPIDGPVSYHGIQFERIPGKHGYKDPWIDRMGSVSGFILKAENEPKVYWAGDTVLTDEIRHLIRETQPDVILTHSCGAELEDSGPIIMDAAQTVEVCRLSPHAVVVATHMEALDHATVTRRDLRKLAREQGISDEHLRIPGDGEIIEL